MKLRSLSMLALALAAFAFGGCKTHQANFIDPFADEVDKQTNGWGLRKLDPKDYPDMRAAWSDKAGLERAIDKSLQFLAAPSSQRFYPSGKPGDTITHDQIESTLRDMKKMLATSITPDQFQQQLLTRYDVYTSIGYNDKGDVWFTGYYTPIYQGSMTPSGDYKYPVYTRPADLVSDPITGEVAGQRMPDGSMRPYPTRSELEASGKLKGLELCYFKDPMEPYIIQVQGSAKVILPNGQEMMIGYAGKNGRDYRGLGSELVKDGKIDKKHLSLPAVLEYFKANPGERAQYMKRNDSFAFLKVYAAAEWPSGSLGVQVTPQRSLATDKSIFPRASITFIDVPKPTSDGGSVPYKGFVLDQDTGGAIKAPGRADIYMGIGPEAGQLAGREFAQGRLFYLFLKPELSTMSHPMLKPTTAPKGGTPTGKPDEMFPGAVKPK